MSYISQGTGIGAGGELTAFEESVVSTIAGLGTANQVLATNAGATDVEWTAAGAGDMVAATYDTGSVAGDAFTMTNMNAGNWKLFYSNGSGDIIELALAASGVLTSNGATSAPSFSAAGSGDLLADGTVPLTANWDVGAFTITGTQFVSDIATGTAPFVVSSTTVVANLAATTAATVTGATQASITTAANLVTVGALNSGSITSGFTSIDVGAGAITTTGAGSFGALTASGVVTLGAASLVYPASDGSAGQFLQSDGAAGLTFQSVTAGAVDATVLSVRKASAGTIAKGVPFYLESWNPSGYAEVETADADDPTKMPALGIADQAIDNTATVSVTISGNQTGMDTSGFSVKDALYVSDAGTMTATKPPNSDDGIQKMGIVLRSHASQGVIQVFGAGRSNDTPNVIEPRADTAAGDNAAIGYTATEGIVITGQGSANDVTIKNDADQDVIEIRTGTTDVDFSSSIYIQEQGAANADSTLWGQLWVRQDNPSTLMYTDGEGLDTALSLAASATQVGQVELATVAETNTGTDTGRAVTPDGLSGAVKSIMLSAAGGAALTTAGCSDPTKIEAATNDINYWVLDFDTTTEEHAFWNFPMPDNWDAGIVNATFYWTNAAGLTTETVDWGIAGGSWADNDAIDAALGTEVTTTDTWIAQGDMHISAASGNITVANATAGEWVTFVVARKVATDDLTGDARLIAVKIEYTIDAYSE